MAALGMLVALTTAYIPKDLSSPSILLPDHPTVLTALPAAFTDAKTNLIPGKCRCDELAATSATTVSATSSHAAEMAAVN